MGGALQAVENWCKVYDRTVQCRGGAPGRRINRFLQVLAEYLKYQKMDSIQAQNRFIMKEEIFTQLYKEIDFIYEAAVYCLAGKKVYQKKGASSLRGAVSFDAKEKKEAQTLRDHAKTLYIRCAISEIISSSSNRFLFTRPIYQYFCMVS